MKSNSNQFTLESSRRENRLTRYCAVGAGAAVCAGAITTADASIVFINYGGQVLTDAVPGNGDFGDTSFDLNNDGAFDFALGVGNGESFGGAAAILAPFGGSVGVAGLLNNGYYYGSKLTLGANVGPGTGFLNLNPSRETASLAFADGYPSSQWLDSSPGYLGIRFTIKGQTIYGWVRISVAPNVEPGARNITIYDAAYETDGTGIAAGAVPEPSTTSLGLVALGMVGLIAHRRRTAKKAA